MTKTVCDFCGNAAGLRITERPVDLSTELARRNWAMQQAGAQPAAYEADICLSCVKQLKQQHTASLS